MTPRVVQKLNVHVRQSPGSLTEYGVLRSRLSSKANNLTGLPSTKFLRLTWISHLGKLLRNPWACDDSLAHPDRCNVSMRAFVTSREMSEPRLAVHLHKYRWM